MKRPASPTWHCCLRAEHVAAAGLSVHEVESFADGLIALATPVMVHYRWRPQLRDPGDEMVLEAAVNFGANALLSFNLRHFREAAHRFELLVLTPGDFFRSLPWVMLPPLVWEQRCLPSRSHSRSHRGQVL